MKTQKRFHVAIACACLIAQSNAWSQAVSIEKPHGPFLIRPYKAPIVPPIRLNNSSRLASLIRGGKLYLTVHDALALAIENNLNLEIDRYGPLLAQSALERALAGGPIRGVPSASAQVSSVNSGAGVNGSTASAGLGGGGGGGANGGGGAAAIQQIGAITPNLDPILQNTTTFSHLSQPQANTIVSQVNPLIDSIHTYNTVLQQGLLTGGYLQFRDYDQYLKENAPSDNLNPVTTAHMDLYIRHSLLQGFGIKLNDRNIRIAKKNIVGARETFRSQLVDLVVNVLNLYWDLVSGNNEVKARQLGLENALKFNEDTKTEIGVGAQARFELPRAELEVASRRQDLLIAQATVRQQETLLKEALSHTEDPTLEAAEIVPLDRIEIPATDELPPLRDLLARALAKRPDVAVSKIRDETAQISAIGTTNPLLPSLQVVAQTYNRAATGQPQIVNGQGPNPYFVGGYGAALGQIFRRNFPNNQASLNFSIPLWNRQAQGDYGIDQLQLRQSEVSGRRSTNQIMVDISNQVSALRQSRARYSAATNTRTLQQELQAAEQKRFLYGAATSADLIAAQRSLVAAQISEVNALATYVRARVSLDQVLGETLESNHISLEEGLSGQVTAPAN